MGQNADLIPPTLAAPAILSFIDADLGPSASYTWITISWNLGGAIFVTVGGRLSDIFGRRWFFLTGGSLLVLGSIVGATGQSILQMIACGAIYGAGSGFLEMAYGAVQEIVPNKYRMATIGMFDTAAIVAQSSPLYAWAIISSMGNWRHCYYLMIGFHVFNVVYTWFTYHPPTFESKHAGSGLSRMQVVREFDWIGLVWFVTGCTLFIIGVNWGGSLHPWTSAATLAPIIFGFTSLVGLGFYEAYGNIKEPLLPPRLFRHVRQYVYPAPKYPSPLARLTRTGSYALLSLFRLSACSTTPTPPSGLVCRNSYMLPDRSLAGYTLVSFPLEVFVSTLAHALKF
jgi:MFS family permease